METEKIERTVSNSELIAALRAELARLEVIADKAKLLKLVWQDFCDRSGKHERNGNYLWNTRAMYDLMEAVEKHGRP